MSFNGKVYCGSLEASDVSSHVLSHRGPASNPGPPIRALASDDDNQTSRKAIYLQSELSHYEKDYRSLAQMVTGRFTGTGTSSVEYHRQSTHSPAYNQP